MTRARAVMVLCGVLVGCHSALDGAAPPGFAPPSTSAPSAASPHGGGGGGAPTPISDEPAGDPTWSIYGPIAVETACAGGAVGAVGRAYVALTGACGDWSTVRALDVGTGGSYTFSVADGVHHLAAFVDCDGDADPAAPAPSVGDVDAAFDGDGCRTYTLHGGGSIELPIVIDRAR